MMPGTIDEFDLLAQLCQLEHRCQMSRMCAQDIGLRGAEWGVVLIVQDDEEGILVTCNSGSCGKPHVWTMLSMKADR